MVCMLFAVCIPIPSGCKMLRYYVCTYAVLHTRLVKVYGSHMVLVLVVVIFCTVSLGLMLKKSNP